MQPSELSKLLGNVSAPTLRRWGKIYSRFLSPGANPPRGKPRRISERDARVLALVAALRDAGHDHSTIIDRLEAEEVTNWRNLPLLFQGQSVNDELRAAYSIARATESSELPALRARRQSLEQRNTELSRLLNETQARIPQLEEALERARNWNNERDQEHQQKLDTLQTELQDAKMRTALLEVRLSQYSLGRERPVNVAIIVSGAVVFSAAVVIILFIVAAIVLSSTS